MHVWIVEVREKRGWWAVLIHDTRARARQAVKNLACSGEHYRVRKYERVERNSSELPKGSE